MTIFDSDMFDPNLCVFAGAKRNACNVKPFSNPTLVWIWNQSGKGLKTRFEILHILINVQMVCIHWSDTEKIRVKR